MSRKSFLLICFVLLLWIFGEAFGALEVQERISWWSDLEAANHLWDEPNNWWTVDYCQDTTTGLYVHVKVEPNMVPDVNVSDVNISAYIGKGEAHMIYPVELRNMILDEGYVMIDPTIDETVVAEANYVLCGGGAGFDPYWEGDGSQLDPDMNNWDPNFHHYLTMTGGELTIGTPQTWEGYEVSSSGMFNGQWAPGRLSIGTGPNWDAPGASGTMTMSGGTINVGGHLEVGAWGGTGTLDMTDGEINIVQGVYCPTSWWGGTGYINLHGGTINARYIRMTEDSYGGNIGIIDVTEGKMIFEQDETDKLILYEDYENLGSTENILNITSYDVNHGEIITDGNYPALVGKRAALVIDYDVSNEGKTTLAAATPTDPNQAWNPSPPDGAANARGPVEAPTNPVLSWSAGASASSHYVYFGTSFEDVNDATTSTSGIYRGKQPVVNLSYPVPEVLDSLASCYWRIDATDGDSTWKGDVWSFTMANLGKASYLSPSNGASGVSPLAVLSWSSGLYSTEHHVYFSTDFDDVNDRDPAVRTIVFTEEYDPPGALDFETRYYWAVDEVGGLETWPSAVLTFKTGDHILVDDFDGYMNTSALRSTWNDGWSNDTGSLVGVDTETVQDGNSLRYDYTNWDPYEISIFYSEIEAAVTDLEVGTNFRAGSVKSLVLWFYGDEDNDANEQMYVVLEDSEAYDAVIYYDGDMNDIKLTQWQEWNIDLDDFTDAEPSLDLTDIAKIYIGFGIRGNEDTPGGEGTVRFEDIRLYRARCVPSFSYGFGDIDGDCVTDVYDLEIMAQDWLICDYNTLGYAGTLMGFDEPDAAWSEDAVDTGSLYFPAILDVNGIPDCNGAEDHSPDTYSHVEIPAIGLNSSNVSMTAWIKTDGIQCEWGTGIVFIRAESASGLNLFGDLLAYHWNDQHWEWDSGLHVPDDTWTFVALVVTPISGKLYMGEQIAYDTGGSWNPEPFADPMWIGQDYQNPGQTRNFRGWIDDVRIYDYSLTDDEIEHVRTFGVSGAEPDPGPFCWYKLDETSGTNAEDSSGGQVVYWPVLSNANYVDPEPQYHRAVNFRDYCAIADNWLEEVLFPIQ